MSAWLRDRRDDDDRMPIRPEVEELLPASVRQPEVNRFTPLGSDMPDDMDDEDLDFLATLAKEVDRATAPTAAQSVAMPVRGADPRVDDLKLFREMKDERGASSRYDFQLRDVDMGDLLEELATVRAALRQRKAA